MPLIPIYQKNDDTGLYEIFDDATIFQLDKKDCIQQLRFDVYSRYSYDEENGYTKPSSKKGHEILNWHKLGYDDLDKIETAVNMRAMKIMRSMLWNLKSGNGSIWDVVKKLVIKQALVYFCSKTGFHQSDGNY